LRVRSFLGFELKNFEPDLAAAQLLPTMDRAGAIGQETRDFLGNLEPAIRLELMAC
jgi:hypothetical protein